ncbi:hypothetical protein B0H19DRAFT_693476 [Mycena capillaripes]|nr:hypothetical protein B0H19DRAFT_693476 [Mycena capillaripes]
MCGELTTILTRYQFSTNQSAAKLAALTSTPPPANASLPFPFSAVEGAYQNLGYGPAVQLCTPRATSAACKPLLANLKSNFPTKLADADLVWSMKLTVELFIVFKHFDGPLFNATGWQAMPTGNSSAPFWAYDAGLEGVVAEFVVQHGKASGFGVRGGFWGAAGTPGEPSSPEPTGSTVEERSEVWFESVHS